LHLRPKEFCVPLIALALLTAIGAESFALRVPTAFRAGCDGFR
jgi:hypothetical protein